QMALQPHIVHVVAHTEANHAARPEDIEEAVKIARGAIRAALMGLPDVRENPLVMRRKQELISDARAILDAIRQVAPNESGEDPWTCPATLCRAVELGILDAPHLKGNPLARGDIVTRMVNGACRAWDPSAGRVLSEAERLARLLDDRSDALPERPGCDDAPRVDFVA
ncbi:MAG: methionine synthase, partial [Bacillota bacterium]